MQKVGGGEEIEDPGGHHHRFHLIRNTKKIYIRFQEVEV